MGNFECLLHQIKELYYLHLLEILSIRKVLSVLTFKETYQGLKSNLQLYSLSIRESLGTKKNRTNSTFCDSRHLARLPLIF